MPAVGPASLCWQKEMPNKSIRYYVAEIKEDLFDIIVLCRWGTIGTSRGGAKSFPVTDLDKAHAKMDDIKKRRAQRGYREIATRQT